MEEKVQHEAYCLKCKMKRIVQDPELVTMKTGMNSVRGTCPVCGGKMYKILPKKKTT